MFQTAMDVYFLYALPFLVLVCLPLFIALFLVKRFAKNIKGTDGLWTFNIPVIVLSIITNIIWEIFFYKHLYYEWDRIALPYTLLSHEYPDLSPPVVPNWIAQGWNQTSLYLLWLSITILIYLVSFFISFLINRNKENWPAQKKFLFLNITALTIMSLIIGAFLPFGNDATLIMGIPFGFLGSYLLKIF